MDKMADLEFLKEDSTIGLIDKAIENKKRRARRYLGMSSIGEPCLRKLWLSYHTKEQEIFSGRMLRLFNMGQMIENRIVRQLRATGMTVTGRQLAFKDHNGKFRGHCDGILSGMPESSKPHILEIKSASDKYFKLFEKNGVEATAPKYTAQCQAYMGYAGLDRAVVIVENKNDSSLYMERIKFHHGQFEALREKAKMIIESPAPLKGISSNPAWWSCKFCNYNHEDACRKVWSGEIGF